MKKVITSGLCSLALICLIYSCSKDIGVKNEMNTTLVSDAKSADGFYRVKVNGESTQSIFTDAEMKSFLTTGKASFLGTVKTLQLTKDIKIKFILKGKTSVVLLRQNGQVRITEYPGDITVLGRQNNGNGGDISDADRCRNGCELRYADCYLDFPADDPDNVRICQQDLLDCYTRCKDYFGKRSYTVSLNPDITIKYQ